MNTTAKTYSLREAAHVTGLSLTKFRYNSEKLIANGAIVSSDGWSIPEATLVTLGWLDTKKAKTVTPRMSVAQQRKALKDIEKLKARVAELEEELTIASTKKGLFSRITGK